MTLLVIWASVDTHGVSATYIASDSRITWGPAGRWDYARKVFALNKHPDVLGYCGDVLFTSQVLSQIASVADAGAMFDHDTLSGQKFALISQAVKFALGAYPLRTGVPEFTIVHCSRDQRKAFHCYELQFGDGRWSERELELPAKSQIVAVYGSGRSSFDERYKAFQKSDLENLSAGVFGAFYDAVRADNEPTVGGAPQLVGIYRNSLGKTFGIIADDQRYILGLPSDNLPNLQALEWRNYLFERCDGVTMQRSEGGQQQPRPRNL